MNKALSYLTTPFFLIFFLGILVFFQPLLFLAYNLGGYKAHKRVLEWMNIFILGNLKLFTAKFNIINDFEIPLDHPTIIISNHQSMFDVPLLITTFPKLHPLFVAKVELAKGIPSISYALRHMGSVLINRKDTVKALDAIQEFGKKIKIEKKAACIFPEGTRARDGVMKRFKPAGFATILKEIPEATIVPVVIAGAWKLLRYNLWPVPLCVNVTMKTLKPIQWDGKDANELCQQIEADIRKELEKLEN